MAAIRPYRFENIPKYSGQQAALLESFYGIFGCGNPPNELISQICDLCSKYLKDKTQLTSTVSKPLLNTGVVEMLPEVGCFAIFSLGGTEHKAIVEIELAMAFMIADKLLGGSGAQSRMHRPLGEIEEGIVSFLFLEALKVLRESEFLSGHVSLTLDGISGRRGDVVDVLPEGDASFMQGFSFAVSNRLGYVRIFTPRALMASVGRGEQLSEQTSQGQWEEFYARLMAMGPIDVQAAVELAHLDLQPAEFFELEAGDIIILEGHELRLEQGKIDGVARLKIGQSEAGYVRGTLETAPDHSYRFHITEIVMQEEPMEKGAMMEHDNSEHEASVDENAVQEPDEQLVAPENSPDQEAEATNSSHQEAVEQLQHNESLLRGVEAPLVVELGRIRMSADQVMRLKPGQVLRLSRSTHDPVDIVVGGKVIARGELIEVEGEIGVRLLQMRGGIT